MGTHDELINIEGKYKAMQKDQILEEKADLKKNRKKTSENFEQDFEGEEIISVDEFKSKMLSCDKSRESKAISFLSENQEKKQFKKELEDKYKDKDINKRLFYMINDKKIGFIFLVIVGIALGTIFPVFSIYFTEMIIFVNLPDEPHFYTKRKKLVFKFLAVGGVTLIGFYFSY